MKSKGWVVRQIDFWKGTPTTSETLSGDSVDISSFPHPCLKLRVSEERNSPAEPRGPSLCTGTHHFEMHIISDPEVAPAFGSWNSCTAAPSAGHTEACGPGLLAWRRGIVTHPAVWQQLPPQSW